MRFRTYGVALAPALQAYCERVQAHPAVARWVREALAETETAPQHDDDILASAMTALRMKTYVVGGAVRDALLGLPVKDRDWVVVGATPEDMLARASARSARTSRCSCIRETQEEYALARTERKTAPGYHGFVFHAAPDVTLEQDLVRRDLTINAIARADDGSLVDPFGGQADIAGARVPPRVRRLPRRPGAHPARWRASRRASPNSRVAPETLALMRSMVEDGEVDALVPERVWQEAGARPDGSSALAHVRGAARVRRAGAHPARAGRAVGRAAAAARTIPKSTPACT